MANWIRKPQEQPGKYRFNGQLYITVTVQAELSPEEINSIVQEIRDFVNQEDGIDYLQVYEEDNGSRRLFFIDQLNDDMKPHHPPEHNHATLLFDWEY
jgi:fibronectin type 3 domain-containing protein